MAFLAMGLFLVLLMGILPTRSEIGLLRSNRWSLFFQNHCGIAIGMITLVAVIFRIPYSYSDIGPVSASHILSVSTILENAHGVWLPRLLNFGLTFGIAMTFFLLIRKKDFLLGLFFFGVIIFFFSSISDQSRIAYLGELAAIFLTALIMLTLRIKKFWVAAVLWGIGSYFRIEVGFLLPLLLIYQHRRFGLRSAIRFVLVGLLFLIASLLIFWPAGVSPGYMQYANYHGAPERSSKMIAANFVMLIGNETIQSKNFWTNMSLGGMVFLFLLGSSYACYYLWHRKTVGGLIVAAFISLFSWFLFTPGLQARELLAPVVLLWLIAGYYRDKPSYYWAVFLSLSLLINLQVGMGNALEPFQNSSYSRAIYILAIVNLGIFLCAFVRFQMQLGEQNRSVKFFLKQYMTELRTALIRKIQITPFQLRKKDLLLVGLIALAYGGVVFYRLGSWATPQTGVSLNSPSQTVEVRFNKPVDIQTLVIYDAEETGQFAVAQWVNGKWTPSTVVATDGYYVLKRQRFFASGVERIQLIPRPRTGRINEIGFLDGNDRLIQPQLVMETDGKLVPAAPHPLFDEQAIMAERPTFLNSTYFDEIYHGRTAYEFIKGYPVYETTHPPLGKDWLASGIFMFGMTPFGMRFSHALTGIFLMVALFFLGRQVLASRFAAYTTMLIGCLDFMPFVESRYASIDTTSVFFMTLLWIFTFQYLRRQEATDASQIPYATLVLVFCSVALAVATKWTGVYAFAGASSCFILLKIRQWFGSKHSNGEFQHFWYFQKNLVPTIVSGLLLFLLIVPAVYFASYIPFLKCSQVAEILSWNSVREVLASQKWMYQYHSGLTTTHPFASSWWGWPFNFKPLWLYSGGYSGAGMKEIIVSLGNPLVWLPGLCSLVLIIYHLLEQRRFSVMHYCFICLLAVYLPWVLVKRVTFIYHYYPVLPLLYVSTAFAVEPLWKMNRSGRRAVLIMAGMAAGAWLLFYPAISGLEISVDYIEKFLRWFPKDWVF
jgi:hypothetical protein